jgi:hypothetical protein
LLPRPQVLANLCHRDKDYGNWNRNEPVFKIPVFIYLTRKLHPHRFKTPKGSDGQSSTYQTPRQDIKKNLMKAWHFLHVSSAIIGKHRFLDKASIQPQQTSDHQTNIVQQVTSTGGEFYGQIERK